MVSSISSESVGFKELSLGSVESGGMISETVSGGILEKASASSVEGLVSIGLFSEGSVSQAGGSTSQRSRTRFSLRFFGC